MLHSWEAEWGPQLWAEMQYTMARQPENARLSALMGDILERSHAARLINEHPLSDINPDGKCRRIRLPEYDDRIRTIEQVALMPLRAPAGRVMIFVPLDDTQR